MLLTPLTTSVMFLIFKFLKNKPAKKQKKMQENDIKSTRKIYITVLTVIIF